MDEEKLEVIYLDSEKKRVTIGGVKYIRSRKNCRERTITVPKCRKQYMVLYRKRKKDELQRLNGIVNEHNMRTDVSSSARTQLTQVLTTCHKE